MKILFVFGTRPEAIKLAPLIKGVNAEYGFRGEVCITAQHREMLDQTLKIFKIHPEYDLNIMERNQDLFDIISRCLNGIKLVLGKTHPDIVIVQGDTTTAFVAGLAAFFLRIPVAHVEAGLRTYNKFSPFPEEMNRHLLSTIADFHFAPTEWAKDNLIREGVPKNRIWVTGNTVVDALLMVSRRLRSVDKSNRLKQIFKVKWGLEIDPFDARSKIILVTGHRRESFGGKFKNICFALKDIASKRPNVTIVYPVHLNPNVQRPVRMFLSGIPNIYLIDPLEYDCFVFLMNKAYLLLTDSGGIQEEALSLNKPVLLMRDTTERPEGIKAGGIKLVGTSKARIVKEVLKLLDDQKAYQRMSKASNPYGDGKAAKKIFRILNKEVRIQIRRSTHDRLA